MTDNLNIDLALLASVNLLLFAVPWIVLRGVYVGIIDTEAYIEQRLTEVKTRVFLVFPATVALCWLAVSRLTVAYELLIAIYAAVIVRAVAVAARFGAANHPRLWWFFWLVLTPPTVAVAVVVVGGRLARGDLGMADWIFGGLGAMSVPPTVVATAGRVGMDFPN